MKKLRGLLLIATLSACGGGGGGVEDPPPTPPPDDNIFCGCTCQADCDPSQVIVDHDIAGGPINPRCAPDATPTTLQLTRQACGAAGNYAAACVTHCEMYTAYMNNDEHGHPVIVPNFLTCTPNGTVTLQSTMTCTASSYLRAASDGDGLQDTAAVSMQAQGSFVRLTAGEAFFDLPNTASGTISLRGANCPGRSCAVSIAAATLRLPGFSDPFSDISVGETVIGNQGPILGTKAANGQLTFPASALNVSVGSSLGGMPVAAVLVPDAPLGGSYDAVTGQIQLSGTFTDPISGRGISLSLAGQATARPPIANAGPDQSLACTAGGQSTVTVSASQSFDPDGDAITFRWLRNGVPFATSAVATLQLGSGTNELTLAVTDATGRLALDSVRVTVTDPSPPTFTFVPPTVVVETSGPVNIGQALAADGCSGTATVTNNAPSSFPIGRTVVTWTATDPSGNRATATQLVYVLPPIAASCPSGSHVILGTSNNDVLIGTAGNDCIIGFGGQDRIEGRGGNDTLLGGEGDDVILGGTGDDVISGGAGQDNCSGEAGNDLVAGTGGDDILSGGDANDTLAGGDGQDRLNGDAGNDTLVGNAGDDIMNGGAGTDRCVADQGHDQRTACE